jgi:NADH-quinone oxidoreductase subunit G
MSHETTIIVNGNKLQVDSSKMLIEELHKHDISVPHFCYHEALGVDGNCRMCMVEIKGQKRPQIACNTPIKEGMEVSTTSEMIQAVKREILELELINHPVDCPICDQAGECSLQEYYMEVGLHESRIDIEHKTKKEKAVDLGSNVILDQERCVLCARCTRFTSNITHTHDLVIADRGNHACVTTFSDTPLEAKGYAMNVVDLCPVGALTSKDFRFKQRVWFLKNDNSICHGCATGCNIIIDHNAPKYEDDKIYRFRPRKNLSVNGHFMCDYGRLSYKTLNENRFFNTPKGNHASLAEIKELLSDYEGHVYGLLSASLSIENLLAISLFAQKAGIKLYASETSTLDPSFKDDMLKAPDRSSNRAGLELLGFKNESILLDSLQNPSLILNFNNPDYINEKDSNNYRWIHFTSHLLDNDCLNFPMPTFSEENGTVINHNYHLQKFESTIKHPLPPMQLKETLAILCDDENLKSRDYLWQHLRDSNKLFSHIHYETIPDEGQIIEDQT